MGAPYSRGVIKFVKDIPRVGNGKLLLVVLSLMLLASIVNKAAAMPYLNNLHNVPLFIQFFVIFVSIYHSAMFILLKEIHKGSFSSIWNNLTDANFLGILLTVVTASLLYELHSVSNVGHLILVFAAVLDVVTHYFAIIVLYYLITPIIKKKINIFEKQYLIYYAFLAIVLYFIANIVYILKYPLSTHFIILILFFVFSILIIIYYSSALLFISKGYAELGFVRKPFLIGGIGMISYLVSVSLIVYYIVSYLTPATQKILYYNISLYSIFFVFTILYFFRFIIEYPSLLQPKWKALVPFDLPKATATITLAFLAASLYFTAKEYPNFIIYQNISYLVVAAFLLPFFLAVILIFTYLKTISTRIKLRYWVYLKYGVYIHLTVTFYVFAQIFLSWNNATSITKMLCAMFGLATFAFYMFFTLDLRKISEDRNIKPTFNGLDILRYTVSLSSFFIIIFFGISFTYGKTFAVFGFELVSYPIILFLIGFSLIALWLYLRVTHIVFEEIRGNIMWGTLTYITTFISLLLVYLIYSSLSTYTQRFPFRDLSFIGYFIVMLCGIASILTLRRETKYKKIEEEEIAAIPKDKVLMLPEDLRSQFDADIYYPILFEKVVNTLIGHLEAFIPFAEQEKIFSQLKRRDEEYTGIEFERGEIRLKEGARLSRDEFFKLFKYYLESLEDKFPFKPFLLYELIREELKKELEPYDITVGNLLDIVPTGLEEMDKVMGGGLAKGSSTLLIAEETKTKHKILLSFIKQGLREGTNVIYATSKRPARQIQGELLTDFADLQNFMLLDLYEDMYREERVYNVVEEEHRIIIPLNMILFQRSIVKTIKSYPRDLPKMVVIDVYDNFSRYYSPEEVQKILQAQIDGLKRWNCTCLIALDPRSYLIKKVGEEEVKKNFDNVMILSGDDKDASIFIEKLYHGTPSKPVIRLQ